jgi:hypothetical protein
MQQIRQMAGYQKLACVFYQNILSEEEAYSFYNKYAETIGFSIRRSSDHKMKNSSTMQQRTFTCSRQGMCYIFMQ